MSLKLNKYRMILASCLGVILVLVGMFLYNQGSGEQEAEKFLRSHGYEVVHVDSFINYVSVFCIKYEKSYPFIVRTKEGERRGVVCINNETGKPRFGINALTATLSYPVATLRE